MVNETDKCKRCSTPLDADGYRMAVSTVDINGDSEVVLCEGCTVTLANFLHIPPPPKALHGFDMVEFLERRGHWSLVTFGHGKRLEPLLEHLRRELAEARRKPSDITEWIDIALLAFDGAFRQGHTAHDVVAALLGKQAINEARDWPPPTPGEPTEHVRKEPSAGELQQRIAEAAHEYERELNYAIGIACGHPVEDDRPVRMRRHVYDAAAHAHAFVTEWATPSPSVDGGCAICDLPEALHSHGEDTYGQHKFVRRQ